MKALSTDIRALIASRLETSTPTEILRIASAIAANEQIEAVSKVAALSSPRGLSPVADAPRYVNLDADGKPTSGEHVAVYDRRSSLVWSRALVGTGLNWKAAIECAAKFKLFGHACRAPTIEERIGITDFARHSPALDTEHFAKEEGWEWTSTPDASVPSVYAWVVYLGYGGAYRFVQGLHYGVRAVLAGQSLNLSF